MDSWSSEEKRQFNEDWANDDFLCWDDEAQQPHFHADEPLDNQVGDGGKRKLSDSESPSKHQKSEEYFTVKSVKQVNVRKFKTTYTDYAVQFHDFNIHGVLNIMPTLNRAFKHLFGRLTTDMAPHDQVRLILNSHQLDKPISLPFMSKEKLTPERFLAAVEHVVQSNDHFTLDDSVNVNLLLCGLIYSGPEADKCLYLYHHDNHYDVITSMPAFLARKQYCHKCKKGYDKITDHPCGDLCKLCHMQNCPVVNWTFCQDCNRFFKGDECFARHKDASGEKKALCTSLAKCQRCQRVVTQESINDHHCGLVRCTVCQKYVEPENHQCYIQPIETRYRQAAHAT